MSALADLEVASISHRDGVPWYEAPRPRRFLHRHSAQTTSNIIERCACGALRYIDGPHPIWLTDRAPRFRGVL